MSVSESLLKSVAKGQLFKKYNTGTIDPIENDYIKCMLYTNRKSLKYEDQVLETNKIYRRPPYILNNSREKNATQ